MNSTNEWGNLKSVIVGVADHAKIPEIDISLRTVNYAATSDQSNIRVGPYPQWVIDEANEDLEILCNFLESQHVNVLRPDKTDCEYYNYCPRDVVVVHGDKSLAAPMPLKARRNDYMALEKHLSNLTIANRNHSQELFNTDCIGNKDILALRETTPCFDAANIIRANDDILYLVSNSGNKKGAEYLQEYLGSGVKVHTLEGVYSYMHIDSTVAFLREGLMLLNPSRIKSKDVLPDVFKSWDVIWCPDPIEIGYAENYCHSSGWINMNLLSISPNLVTLEKTQTNLQRELEKYKIDCAMLPMRHCRTLGGSFHCVTLDLEREK
jgi:N-dimethylarginine dimethylaminohydrolase